MKTRRNSANLWIPVCVAWDGDTCITRLLRALPTWSGLTDLVAMLLLWSWFFFFFFWFICFWHEQNSPCSFPLHIAIPFSATPSPSELGLSEDSFCEDKKIKLPYHGHTDQVMYHRSAICYLKNERKCGPRSNNLEVVRAQLEQTIWLVCHKSFKNIKRTKEKLTELTVTRAWSLFLANNFEKILGVHKLFPSPSHITLTWLHNHLSQLLTMSLSFARRILFYI